MLRLAFLLITSFAFSALQSDEEIARWIADLGHDEIVRREAAFANLAKGGAKSIPALKKALDSKGDPSDATTRARIEELVRTITEREHDDRERRQKLQLFSFDGAETRLGDVLAEVEIETKYKILSTIDPELRVRVAGKDQPLRKILDAIETQLDLTIIADSVKDAAESHGLKPTLEVRKGRTPHPPQIHVPGESFTVRKRRFEVDGKLVGWVIQADHSGRPERFLDTMEIKGPDGLNRPFENCAACGPHRVLVRSDKPEELRVRIQGNVLWNSEYEFTVANPESPQDFRVGRFAIRYEFPKVRVTSSGPLDYFLFGKAGFYGEGKAGGFNYHSKSGGVITARNAKHGTAWCLGKGALRTLVRTAISEETYDLGRGKASDFKSWKIDFSKPMFEPFNEEVVIPAD